MTLPLISPLLPIDGLAARLTPNQQHLILQMNMAHWQQTTWTLTDQEQGLLISLYRLGIINTATGSLTHQGVLVAGYLTLQRLCQDP